MSDPVFECRSASVTFALRDGPRPIIHDISLEIHNAEFLSIVGPSGTGKTTLLRMLGGLLQPTAGDVLIKGRVMTGPPEDVVIVFQDYANALLQWRTVANNVSFGIERALPRKECADRVRQVLDLVGLLGRADDYPWQLSGGMQQRVQIARAGASPGRHADGRAFRGARCHDQGQPAGRVVAAAGSNQDEFRLHHP